jgi:hypothetical protein
MHGRQLAINPYTGEVIFLVCKRSCIKAISLRHNLEVSIGDDQGDVRVMCCHYCALNWEIALSFCTRTCFTNASMRAHETAVLCIMRRLAELCNSVQCYLLEADLMGRTITFKNQAGELIAIAAKSTKTLIMSSVRAQSSWSCS